MLNRITRITLPIFVLAILISSFMPQKVQAAGMSQILFGGYNYNLDTGSTTYSGLTGASFYTDETTRTQLVTTAGSINNLYVELSGSPGAGKSYAFTLRVNGANTALTCTVNDAETSDNDTAHSVNVVAGDRVSIGCVPSGTPTARYPQWSTRFNSSTNNESLILGNAVTENTGTRYVPLSQCSGSNSAVEDDAYQIIPTSGSIKNLYIYMAADPGTNPDGYRYTLRKNGVSQTLTVTITADNTTGNDTAHSIAVVGGDKVDLMVEPLNTPAVEPEFYYGFTFLADINGESLILGGTSDDMSAGVEYSELQTGWLLQAWTGTEADREQLGQVCVLKNLYVQLSGTPYFNSHVDDYYLFTVRVNAGSPANGLVAKVESDNTTANDLTHTITLAAGDNVDLMVAPNSGPTPRDAYWGLVCYIAPSIIGVSTVAATDKEDTTATLNGTVTDDNGETIDYYGFVWDTSDKGDPGDIDPSTPAGTWTNGWKSGVGDYGENPFDYGATGLATGTTIYFRAAAHGDASGWFYGSAISFLTKPAAPTGVTASDGTSTTEVLVSWTKSTGATDYHAWRDAVDLGSAGDVDHVHDTGADAPTITPGTASATDGASTTEVTLSVAAESASNGTTHTYKVVASNATGSSDDSATNTGYRGTTTLTYQWRVSAADSDAGFSNIAGTTDPYSYTSAPAGTITPGTATSSDGTSTAHVTLTVAGQSTADGAGRYYYCVVSMTGAADQNTTHDRGYRGIGALSYQWYRSAADSDAGYGALGGATTNPYDDTTAPAPTITAGSTVATDGTFTSHIDLSLTGTSANVGAGRYFYCTLSASGAANQDTTHDRGYRGVGALTYQWQRSAGDSDATYSNIGGATSSTYVDSDVPIPTVTPGTASATDGTQNTYVTLSVAGASANNGAGRYYKCVLDAAGAVQQTSASNRGYCGVGSLTYQWSVSSADADADFSELSGATSTPYNDTAAPAGVVTPGAADATNGTSTSFVTLSIAGASTANGAGRYYYCTVSAAGAISQGTTHDRGYRGIGALTYQWYRSAANSDAAFSSLAGATTAPYNDNTSPAPTISSGSASASDGAFVTHVELSISGDSANNGEGRYFYCVVSASGAVSQDTTHDQGYIGVGALTYQWYRSAADSDAAYGVLAGAVTDPYNDLTAPADGSGRFYYCHLTATGAANQDTNHDRGYVLTFVPPTVVTGICTGFTSSSAVVNGMITAHGDNTTSQYGFDYGLTVSYGSSSLVAGTPALGATYSINLSGLLPASVYHYRAKAYNSAWGYGADATFSTTGSPVLYESFTTAPDTSFTIQSVNWGSQTFTTTSAHDVVSIYLNIYRVGSPGDVTVSIRHTAAGVATGEDLCTGTIDGDTLTTSTSGSWYPIAMTATSTGSVSLENATKYAIVVRAINGDGSNYIKWLYLTAGGYTGGNGVTSTTSGIAWTTQTYDFNFQVWGNAILEVLDAKVFTDYRAAGDWLVVLLYKNIYPPYYDSYDVKSHFVLQLTDASGDVKAQVACPAWDYKPGSIYLSAGVTTALTYGGDYRVRLYGTFIGNPYSEYTLQPIDWLGSDLTRLDSWVLSSARLLAEYYEETMTTYIANRGEVLNPTGGVIFANGITALSAVRPNLFQITSSIATPPTDDFPQAGEGATTWQAMLGPYVTARLTDMGGVFGVDGKAFGAWVIVAVMAALMAFGLPTGHTAPANILATPLFLMGLGLRLFDWATGAVMLCLIAFLVFYQLYFKTSS